MSESLADRALWLETYRAVLKIERALKEQPEASTALPEILDAAIIRNPQPDDVLVLKVAASFSAEQCHNLADEARRALPCRVVILSGDIEIATVAEVTL